MNIFFWRKKPKKTDWNKLIFSFFIIIVASIIASLFAKKDAWYETIKPGITPPSFVFYIIWPILYIMLAFSLYLTISPFRKKLFQILSINLIANFIWTFLYFKLQMPLLALIDLIIIWLSAAFLIKLSWKIDKRIAYLTLPYFTWITFAGIINILAVINYCQLYCSFR